MPRAAASPRRALLAALALAAALAPAAPRTLVALRSDQSGLPESIARETLASVDRACDSLRALGAGDPRAAAALSEPGVPAPELGPALDAVAATLDRPWTPREAEDAVFALLGAAFAGAEPPAPLLRRLERERLDALPPGLAALALSALDAFGADDAAGWDRLAERPVPADPTLASVAAAALARRARARRRGVPDDPPPADVLAHVRWLAARLDLRFRASGAAPDAAHPLDPESALLVALLASSLPRRALADPSLGLFPVDWRNHLADRLLALQVSDPPGVFRWTSPDGDSVRATTLAVLALRLLAAD